MALGSIAVGAVVAAWLDELYLLLAWCPCREDADFWEECAKTFSRPLCLPAKCWWVRSQPLLQEEKQLGAVHYPREWGVKTGARTGCSAKTNAKLWARGDGRSPSGSTADLLQTPEANWSSLPVHPSSRPPNSVGESQHPSHLPPAAGPARAGGASPSRAPFALFLLFSSFSSFYIWFLTSLDLSFGPGRAILHLYT